MKDAALRPVGFFAATGIGVAAIVGGGIFVLGGLAIAEAGPAAVVAFALNGVIAFLTAMTFAELATSFPENGGQYAYARRAFSVRDAFAVGWVMVFAHIVAAVLYAMGFAAYASGALSPLLGEGGPLVAGVTLLLALLAVAFYSLRLLRSPAGGGQAENVIKVGVFLFLIIAGLALIARRGPAEALAPLTPFFDAGWTGIVAAMGLTFIAMQGFELIAGVAGEVRDPDRNIPRAMFWSLGIALGIYLPLLLVVSSVGVPGEGLTPAEAATLAPETYFADSAQSYLGAFGYWLVMVAAILSTLTALGANLLAASRVAAAMASHRTLPRALGGRPGAQGAPRLTVAIVAGVVALLIVVLPGLSAAGAAASLVFLVTYAITHVCAWRLRRRRGALRPGAFATPFFPAVPLIGFLACGALVLFQIAYTPVAALVLLAWSACGLSLYLGFLSGRAESMDAAAEGIDPELRALRGMEPTILVPLANPARAASLATVAGALVPRGSGRILLHRVVLAGPDTPEQTLRDTMAVGSEALTNALLQARHDHVHADLRLSVAPDPWEEILRVARVELPDAVLLGMAPPREGGADDAENPMDRMVRRLPCNVALLHAPHSFDWRQVRRALIPLSGARVHDRLRARFIGTLARSGVQHMHFLRVLPADASERQETDARRQLRLYLHGEALGRGDVDVLRSDDPIDTLIAAAADYDILVLGITRVRDGQSRVSHLLGRILRSVECPVLILSHADGGDES